MIELVPIHDKSIRQLIEEREHEILSPFAAFSDMSQGRDVPEEPCDLRTEYQRDRDRILYSKAFRRLNGKTQVFLAPEGDHYRTRLTHTLEVAQTARAIAKSLRLNDDLTESIALGHDLGHTPFGHAGERALDRIMMETCGEHFRHFEQSIRVVDIIEKHGEGLNLSKEVKDGILNHQMDTVPATLEGRVVRLSDKMAYINHDIDDAVRGNIIKVEDVPKRFRDVLGNTLTSRLNTEIHDIIKTSIDTDDVRMSDGMKELLGELREWMFATVYTNPTAKGQESKAEALVIELFNYYRENPDKMPEEYVSMIAKGQDKERVVCDYVAGMTDRFAVARFRDIKVPTSWDVY